MVCRESPAIFEALFREKFTAVVMIMMMMVVVSVSLFAAGILQCLCNNGAIPLYYELAIESTYPVAEVCTTMMMNVTYNLLPLIFIAINYFTTEELGQSVVKNVTTAILMLACAVLFPLQGRVDSSDVKSRDSVLPQDSLETVFWCLRLSLGLEGWCLVNNTG